MSVIAYSTVAGVNAAHLGNSVANFVYTERVGKTDVIFRDSDLRIEPVEQIAAHISLETHRMGQRYRSALPVKVLIHIEGVDIFPAYPLFIGNPGQNRILGSRSYRQNYSGWSALSIIGLYLIGYASGEVLIE